MIESFIPKQVAELQEKYIDTMTMSYNKLREKYNMFKKRIKPSEVKIIQGNIGPSEILRLDPLLEVVVKSIQILTEGSKPLSKSR